MAPALSLILCSRNDSYMGNARWRLETALNYVALRVGEMGRVHDVEVLVTDWGSDVPLSAVVRLSPLASRIVSFVHVPPAVARDLQQDSPFPEVLALNAAARRATGTYIGRIDQDTLVGGRFLRFFFDVHEGRTSLEIPMPRALLFSNQRMVPYRFTSRSPSLPHVEGFIEWFGRRLTMEYSNPRASFYSAGVGIWLVHRDLWHECRGYDERMIYMNKMETNMVRRLLMKYQIVNLGTLVDYDFYHLEHYHPHAVRRSSSHRSVNSADLFHAPTEFTNNAEDWGLASHPIEAVAGAGLALPADRHPGVARLSLPLALVPVVPMLVADAVRRRSLPWRQRAARARRAVSGQPLLQWPRVLRALWASRAHRANGQM